MNSTKSGWALFFAGYSILMVADYLMRGMSEGLFQVLIYALVIPSVYFLSKGSRGKGSFGIRVLLVITQFWLAYALAALIWLFYSKISGIY